LKCKEKGTHEHKLEKLKGVPGDPTSLKNKDKDKMTEEEKNWYLENLLDEYYNLDYEDIIGGGSVKTRFKYRKVNQNDYGLTEDEILLLDDKQLNRLVSLKKYRSYIDQEDEKSVNMHRLINIKKEF
jgi:protein KRI1